MPSRHEDVFTAVPSHWEVLALHEIADRIESGGTPSREIANYWGGDVPWITPGELTKHSEKYFHDSRETISEQGLRSSGAVRLPKHSLIVTTRATLGLRAIAARGVTTNQGFKSIVFGPRAEPSYYYHLFELLKRELTRRASGTTFLEISGREFGLINVPVPPLAEQQRIAEILDSVDESIQTTELLIAKLEKVAKGVETFAIESSLLSAGDVPLIEVAVDSPGSTVIGPFGSDLVASDYRTSGTPVVFVRDIKANSFQWVSDVFVSPSKAAQLSAHSVAPGDVVVTKMGLPPGIAAVYPANVPPGIVTADVIRVRPNLDRVDPIWLAIALNSEASAKQVARITGGVTRPKITLGDYRRLVLHVPPLDVQKRIVSGTADLMQRLRAEQAQLAKLRYVKAGLMHDLLTGRVRLGVGEGVAE